MSAPDFAIYHCGKPFKRPSVKLNDKRDGFADNSAEWCCPVCGRRLDCFGQLYDAQGLSELAQRLLTIIESWNWHVGNFVPERVFYDSDFLPQKDGQSFYIVRFFNSKREEVITYFYRDRLPRTVSNLLREKATAANDVYIRVEFVSFGRVGMEFVKILQAELDETFCPLPGA